MAEKPLRERYKLGKRGRIPSILKHPQRHEIECAIANGINPRLIAEKYGLHLNTINSHARRMTPERKAVLCYSTDDSLIDLEAIKKNEARSVVTRCLAGMADLQQLYDLALKLEDFAMAIRAKREYRNYLELQAKLVGELIAGDRHLHVAVAESPAYRRLVALVMSWVENDPAKMADLSSFLENAENPPEAPVIEHVNGHDHSAS